MTRQHCPGLDRAGVWLAAHLNDTDTAPPTPLVAEAVARHVPTASTSHARTLMSELLHEVLGLGPLAEWASTESITDVLVTDGHVWVDGLPGTTGLHRTEMELTDDQVHQLATRLVAQGGKRLDAGHPFADVFVAGCRVHAVIPPVVDRPQLSIRVPSSVSGDNTATLTALAASWNHAEYWLDLVNYVVAGRLNALISGATGAGKTTLLAALLALVDPTQRIITIEDTPELRINHPHVVSLRTREATAEGTGEITLADLIRQALRMRPDRLIVGECRGAELADFLSAMNTGHTGAIGTIHANSLEDVPSRLYTMGSLAGLDPFQLDLHIRSAVHVFIHVARDHTGIRQPVQAGVITPATPRTAGHAPLHVDVAVAQHNGHLVEGPGMPALQRLIADAATREHLDHPALTGDTRDYSSLR